MRPLLDPLIEKTITACCWTSAVLQGADQNPVNEEQSFIFEANQDIAKQAKDFAAYLLKEHSRCNAPQSQAYSNIGVAINDVNAGITRKTIAAIDGLSDEDFNVVDSALRDAYRAIETAHEVAIAIFKSFSDDALTPCKSVLEQSPNPAVPSCSPLLPRIDDKTGTVTEPVLYESVHHKAAAKAIAHRHKEVVAEKLVRAEGLIVAQEAIQQVRAFNVFQHGVNSICWM